MPHRPSSKPPLPKNLAHFGGFCHHSEIHPFTNTLFMLGATIAALVSTFAVFMIRTRKRHRPALVRWSDLEGAAVFLGFWSFYMLCVVNHMSV